MARAGLTAREAIYIVIGLLAVGVALGHGGKETNQNGALRTVTEQPFGKGLLWLLALGFAGYALWREKLGMIGTVSRGFVFALAGFFVVQAAITFDRKKARGLDGALKSLVKTPLGPWLLVVVPPGLVAFGIYGLAEARYRRTSDGSR